MSSKNTFSMGKKSCKKKSKNSWTPKSAFHVRNISRQELCDSLRLKTMPSSEVKRVKLMKGAPYVPFDDYWIARRKYKDQLIKEMLRDRTERRSQSVGLDEKRWVDKENLKYVLVHPLDDEQSFHYLDNDYPYDFKYDPKYFYLNYNTYKDLEGKLQKDLPNKKNMKFFQPLYYDYLKKGEKQLKEKMGPDYHEYKLSKNLLGGDMQKLGNYVEQATKGRETGNGNHELLAPNDISVFKTINDPAKKKKELEKSKKLSRQLEEQSISSSKHAKTVPSRNSQAKTTKNHYDNIHHGKKTFSSNEGIKPTANDFKIAADLKNFNALTAELEAKKLKLSENRLRGDMDLLICQIKNEKDSIINKYEHEIRLLRENSEKNAHILTEFKLRLEHTGPYVKEMEKNLNRLDAEKKLSDDELLRIARGEIQTKTQADGLREGLRAKELDYNSLNQRLLSLQHEKNGLTRDIDELRRQRVAMDSKLVAIRGENERLNGDIFNETQSLRSEIERLTQKNNDFNRLLNQEGSKLDIIEKKIKSNKNKSTHLKENIKSDSAHLEEMEKERLILLDEIEKLRLIVPPQVERVRERTVKVEKQVTVETDSGWEELRAARERFDAHREELIFLEDEERKVKELCDMRSQEIENIKFHCLDMEEEHRRLDGRIRAPDDLKSDQRVRDMENRLIMTKERNKKLFDHLNDIVSSNERKNNETQNFISILEERNRVLEQKRMFTLRANH